VKVGDLVRHTIGLFNDVGVIVREHSLGDFVVYKFEGQHRDICSPRYLELLDKTEVSKKQKGEMKCESVYTFKS